MSDEKRSDDMIRRGDALACCGDMCEIREAIRALPASPDVAALREAAERIAADYGEVRTPLLAALVVESVTRDTPTNEEIVRALNEPVSDVEIARLRAALDAPAPTPAAFDPFAFDANEIATWFRARLGVQPDVGLAVVDTARHFLARASRTAAPAAAPPAATRYCRDPNPDGVHYCTLPCGHDGEHLEHDDSKALARWGDVSRRSPAAATREPPTDGLDAKDEEELAIDAHWRGLLRDGFDAPSAVVATVRHFARAPVDLAPFLARLTAHPPAAEPAAPGVAWAAEAFLAETQDRVRPGPERNAYERLSRALASRPAAEPAAPGLRAAAERLRDLLTERPPRAAARSRLDMIRGTCGSITMDAFGALFAAIDAAPPKAAPTAAEILAAVGSPLSDAEVARLRALFSRALAAPQPSREEPPAPAKAEPAVVAHYNYMGSAYCGGPGALTTTRDDVTCPTCRAGVCRSPATPLAPAAVVGTDDHEPSWGVIRSARAAAEWLIDEGRRMEREGQEKLREAVHAERRARARGAVPDAAPTPPPEPALCGAEFEPGDGKPCILLAGHGDIDHVSAGVGMWSPRPSTEEPAREPRRGPRRMVPKGVNWLRRYARECLEAASRGSASPDERETWLRRADLADRLMARHASRRRAVCESRRAEAARVDHGPQYWRDVPCDSPAGCGARAGEMCR